MSWPTAALRGALLAALALSLAAPPTFAASFTVDSTADAVDSTLGDGICANAAPACTLRAAVQEANALAGPDQINVPAGTYHLTITGTGEDAAATGDLDVTGDLTIIGASGRGVKLSAKVSDDLNAQRVDRVFDVIAGGSLALAKLTVQDGNGSIGGQVRSTGSLTMVDTTLGGAPFAGGAFSTEGAGLWSSGPVDLNRVTITGNRATKGGGLAVSGALTAVNTTIFGNNATADGGGIDVLSGGSADLTNVTLALNWASNGSGGQIFNSGSVQVRNSIFERTSGSAANCGGAAPISGGHNVDDDGSCALASSGDRGFSFFGWTNYELVNAGGETDVLPNYDLHALDTFAFPGIYPQPGPAVDIGAAGCPALDQRGVARPQGSSCDAGAYEATFADVVLTAVGVPEQVVSGDPIRYSLVLRNDGPGTVTMPRLAGSSAETGFPIPSMGGTPCQYFTCEIAPLAPGASAAIDIEMPTNNKDGARTATADWTIRDMADARAWNIDPDPGNTNAHITVPVLARPTPPPAAQPQAPAPKPCSVPKTGTKRNNVLRGTAGPDLLRGLAGNDKLAGLAGDDCLDGGAGNDSLNGGRGKDKLLGGKGNDVIDAVDHEKDTVDCGKGRDRATVDKIDRVKGCEKVKRKR